MLIKTTDDFLSCTITSVSDDGDGVVEYAPFKQALFDTSNIIMYEYEGDLYYPLALEFRLIDNNVLFLIKELGVMDVDQLFTILSSSMKKVEKWTNVFNLVVIHLKNEPRYMYKLPEGFDIGDAQHIYEEE